MELTSITSQSQKPQKFFEIVGTNRIVYKTHWYSDNSPYFNNPFPALLLQLLSAYPRNILYINNPSYSNHQNQHTHQKRLIRIYWIFRCHSRWPILWNSPFPVSCIGGLCGSELWAGADSDLSRLLQSAEKCMASLIAPSVAIEVFLTIKVQRSVWVFLPCLQ